MFHSLRTFAAKIAAFKSEFKDIWNTFFDISEGYTSEEKKEKVEATLATQLLYFMADYWLAIAFAAMVISMKAWNIDRIQIFFAGWFFDFIVALALVIQDRATGVDVTLGRNMRRVTDYLRKKNKVAGIALAGGLSLKALVWDGPAQIAMMFRKEFSSWLKVTILLLFLTSLQTLFWITVWSFGYETLESESSPLYIVSIIAVTYAMYVRRYFAKGAFNWVRDLEH